MDLTQLANLGEFIGGVAVLATLVYLAIQVRQNTRSLQATRHQESLRMAQGLFAPFVENREFADFIRMARDTPESLDETD